MGTSTLKQPKQPVIMHKPDLGQHTKHRRRNMNLSKKRCFMEYLRALLVVTLQQSICHKCGLIKPLKDMVSIYKCYQCNTNAASDYYYRKKAAIQAVLDAKSKLDKEN